MASGSILPTYADNTEALVIDCEDEYAISLDYLRQERDSAWDDYCRTMLSDPVVQSETADCAMTYGDAVMRYSVTVKGDQPEGGYPLYIALHGGGSADTPDFNDEQWEDMMSYYCDELDCGVYITVRGVRDTWDTHFNPESYPLYDRLIEYAILTLNIDPNRVYLEGFSAGGDGVYAICFYYLRAPYDTDAGLLTAALNRDENTVSINAQGLNGPFSLLLNEEMVDFSQPIGLIVNGEATVVSVTPDRQVLFETTYDRGDPCYQFEAEIHFDAAGNVVG